MKLEKEEGGSHYNIRQLNFNISLVLSMFTSFLISPYNKFRSAGFWPSRKSLSSKRARATVKVDPGGMDVPAESRLMASCTDKHTGSPGKSY